MMAVLALLFPTLRNCVRSQATLQLELLALRHQLQVLERSRRPRPRLSVLTDPLGLALTSLDRVASDSDHRQAGSGPRMASPRLRLVLDVEEPSRRFQVTSGG
jgi:hypothetical protein